MSHLAKVQELIGPRTANERLLDASVRHALFLQRYQAGEVRRVIGFLNAEVFPDLLGKVESIRDRIHLRGYDSGPWTTQRYRDLLADTWEILRDGAKEVRSRQATELRALAKVESAWAVRALDRATPVGISFEGLNLNAVQVVVSQPIHGQPLSGWWSSLARDTQRRLQTQIGVGLAQGETADQIVRRVRGTQARRHEDGVLEVTRRQAAAIVRTSSNHVSTQAREMTYAANTDVVDKVQWVSTLDTRTSPICQARDGQVFPVGDGPRPPAHVNCRSVVVPVLKSWKELGIDLDEFPEGTRASMDGQVPSSLTYGEWLRQQSAERQDEALGRAPVRRNQVRYIDFAGPEQTTARTLTLAELGGRD